MRPADLFRKLTDHLVCFPLSSCAFKYSHFSLYHLPPDVHQYFFPVYHVHRSKMRPIYYQHACWAGVEKSFDYIGDVRPIQGTFYVATVVEEDDSGKKLIVFPWKIWVTPLFSGF